MHRTGLLAEAAARPVSEIAPGSVYAPFNDLPVRKVARCPKKAMAAKHRRRLRSTRNCSPFDHNRKGRAGALVDATDGVAK
jgi:hypothetical protein